MDSWIQIHWINHNVLQNNDGKLLLQVLKLSNYNDIYRGLCYIYRALCYIYRGLCYFFHFRFWFWENYISQI